MNGLFSVGHITNAIAQFISGHFGDDVYQSSGLKKHIQKRHPECVKYIGLIPNIIASPDYIGVNPNEAGTSFELVKRVSENVQIGIKLDISKGYFYVATLHTITSGKLNRRIQSGRLVKVN